MNGPALGGLLEADDPPPVQRVNLSGSSPFLLIGDHAGNAIPRRLSMLGLGPHDLARHIAWDIGTADLGVRLAERLDAVFVRQTYSRLVIDCNRSTTSPEAILSTSDGTAVPGNGKISQAEREARIREIHTPYHEAIAQEIRRREAAGRPTILIALHSFTPSMAGIARPWHIGVLHDGRSDGFARRLLAQLQARADLVVGDNQPYAMDATDYTIPHHAFRGGLPYAELEIRQDLLGTHDAIERWAALLADSFDSVVPDTAAD